MITSFVIMFREMLEMSLVLGVLLAAVRGLGSVRQWILLGVLSGACVAFLLGVGMDQLESSFSGNGEFLLHALLLLTASGMLGWTVLWVRRHAPVWVANVRRAAEEVRAEQAPKIALAVVAFAAVAREGSEAAFFLLSAAQAAGAQRSEMFAGGLLGGALAVALGFMLHVGLVRLPVGKLLSVAGWLLMLIAAGMASQGVWNLVVIGWLPPIVDPVWDLSDVLPSDGVVGGILQVLVGYDDAPSATQLVAFALTLAALAALDRRLRSAERAR